MPVGLHLIRASEFVCLDADELLDFVASKKALEALAHACRKRGLDHAVLDLRMIPVPARPQFTKHELATLVLTFRDAGFAPPQRLALLYEHDVHGGIRDFAFISRMRGLQVQAFANFEAAMHWLSEGPPCRDESRQTETPVPITKHPGKVRKLAVTTPAGMRRPGGIRRPRGGLKQRS